MKANKETIIRTIITGIALLNALLTMSGKNPLPFSDDEIYTFLSMAATLATTLWVWWKNNSFTVPAIKADKIMQKLKEDSKNE